MFDWVYTVTYNDILPPDFTVPADVTIQADANCNYNADPAVTGRPSGVSDNCTVTPTVGYTDVISAGTQPGTRILTRTWSVSDNCNNKTSKVQRITIIGGAPPVLVLTDHCVYLNKFGSWTLNSIDIARITSGSSGGCGTGTLNYSFSTRSFNCNSANKIIPVVVTATDGMGNTVSGTVKVSVLDTIAPVAVCRDVTLTLDNFGQAYLNQSQVNNGSYDNCSISSTMLSKQLFTVADVGVNEVLLVVKDPSGNAGTCMAKITVNPQQTALAVPLMANKAPTIDNISEVKVVNEPLTLNIPLSNITPGELTGSQKVVSVSAVSDNTALVKGMEVQYQSGQITGKLVVTLAPGTSGTALVTMTVRDDGGTENGGTDTYAMNFRIMVENTVSAVYVTVFDNSGIAAVTGVTEVSGEFAAKLWPNPTPGPVNIELSWGDVRKAEVSVYNVLGVEVYRNQFHTGGLIRFDLGGKASGVYMVKIQGGGRTVVKKVTVDRR
jgi:hypothetical protein